MAAAPRPTEMTADEFLVWCLHQDEKYELVDGVPEAMRPAAGRAGTPNPVATFEVLSPTTERTDKMIKLPEYMRHPTLKTILLIEPGALDVLVFRRDEAGEWQGHRYRQLADESELPEAIAKISLAEIYRGVPMAA